MTRLDHKIALVTGGTSGIGLATALELARRGARVYVLGRRPEAGEAARVAAAAEQLELRYLQADMADEDQVRAAYETLARESDRLDMLVASHGTLGNPGPVEQHSAADFRGAVEVNLVGSFLAAKYALPLMREGSAIAFVSSTVGAGVSFPGMSAYAASKAALTALAETLALEVADRNIRVNVLIPGGVDTPMFRSTMGATAESAAYIASLHALGRVGEPGELAQAAAFLVSPEASFVTGTTLVVDGGMRIK